MEITGLTRFDDLKEWAEKSLITKYGRSKGSIPATFEVDTVVLLKILKSSKMLHCANS
jgi:hypothetical protein